MEFAALVLAFLLSAILCFALLKAAPSLDLLVHPGDHRLHAKPTPAVGGIAIFVTLLVSVKITVPSEILFLLPSFCLVVVGVIDDRLHLHSLLRLLAQIVAAYLMIQITGIQLDQLGQLFSDEVIYLGSMSVPLTIFAAVGVINAINMSDGMDGLAGSMVILTLIVLAALGSTYTSLIYLIVASIAGFLVWNVRFRGRPARIFMGDAGSTALGLILAFLFIEITQGMSAPLLPVTALWLLLIPLMDAVCVLIVRPLMGQAPFSADHLHYHHALTDAGLTVNQALLGIVAAQLVFVALAVYFVEAQIPEALQLSLFLLLFFAYFILTYRRARRLFNR
ncbi:MAG: hypothetical protein AAF197_04165 [Pseudomonadota bacterium]